MEHVGKTEAKYEKQDHHKEDANDQSLYSETDELRHLLEHLGGRKIKLDCGHHVTFGYFLGNDITIINGKVLKIICSLCGN